MLSDLCEQEEHGACFEDELDACRCACHPDPTDSPAGEVTLTTEYSGTGRAQNGAAHPRRRGARTGPCPGTPAPAPPSQVPVPEQAPSSPPPLSKDRAAAGIKAPAGAGRRRAAGAVPAGQLAIAAAMSEDRGPDSLDAHVRRLLKDLGLRGYHTHDSRRSEEGFPDWTITGRRTIFRELKTQRGKVSRAQQEWLDALRAAGDDAGVWRPIHLLTGQVAAELRAITPGRLGTGAA